MLDDEKIAKILEIPKIRASSYPRISKFRNVFAQELEEELSKWQEMLPDLGNACSNYVQGALQRTLDSTALRSNTYWITDSYLHEDDLEFEVEVTILCGDYARWSRNDATYVKNILNAKYDIPVGALVLYRIGLPKLEPLRERFVDKDQELPSTHSVKTSYRTKLAAQDLKMLYQTLCQ